MEEVVNAFWSFVEFLVGIVGAAMAAWAEFRMVVI